MKRSLRAILLALLFSLLLGLLAGTLLRQRLERPARYLGALSGLGTPMFDHGPPSRS